MIYIIKHKECEIPRIDGYKEFGVGELYTGHYEYINSFNPYLNEVTALYDIWQGTDDMVGLVHYRRFFKDLSYEKARGILNDYDVITTPDHEPQTPYIHLSSLDMQLVDKYLAMLPDEVKKWFYEHHTFNICNMFVSHRKFLNDYCKWLFPIIFPMTERFIEEDVTEDVRRNRTIGFITECLFGYYCKDFKRYKNEILEI